MKRMLLLLVMSAFLAACGSSVSSETAVTVPKEQENLTQRCKGTMDAKKSKDNNLFLSLPGCIFALSISDLFRLRIKGRI